MAFVCSECKKILSSKSNLNRHMNSYCKNIKPNLQEQNNILKEENKLLKLKIKDIIERELNLKLTIARLEGEINIYKQTDEKQFNSIVNIANQPKTSTTYNKTQNITIPFDLTDPNTISEIQNKLKNNFSKEHLLQGQRGMGRLLVENVLAGDDGKNNKYICTDYSRGTFKYKDVEGNTHVDNGGKKLTNVVLEGVKEEVYDIAKDCMDKEEDDVAFGMITKSVIDIKKLKEDNSKFLDEIVALSK